MVIGEGHTLVAHRRVSLCKQQQTEANQSDDELEYAAKDEEEGAMQLQTLSLQAPFLLA